MKLYSTERTGWRDEEISKRHRHWGFNCPAVDLDFVMMEYNHGKPVALVEYKHKQARDPNINHATFKALKHLADGYKQGPLPCFVAMYDPETWDFKITPINETAKIQIGSNADIWISEQRFVTYLHLIRKSVLTDADTKAINQLNTGLSQKRRLYALTNQ